MEKGLKENKMGVMPINKLLISMSLPMVISMLMQAFYNVVDSFFVAKVSEDALTAVSLVFPVQNLMIAFSTGIAVGVNAVISKALGERDRKTANRAAMQGILIEAVFCVMFLFIGIFLSGVFMRTQTSSSDIVKMGKSYMQVVCCGACGIYSEIIFERLLQSTGKTVYSMISQMSGAVINIILDPCLIFGLGIFPKLGVTGAAVATVIGQVIAGIMAILFNKYKNEELTLKLSGFKPEFKIIGKILYVGIPSVIMVAIGSIMVYFINRILIMFTTTAVAVFGVYFKLQSFAFMPIFGINNGMIPIIAYNYGAGKKQRMKKTVMLSMVYAVCIMLVAFAVMQLFPSELLSIFDAGEDMMYIGTMALRRISLSFLFAGICVITGSVCQALGKGVYSMLVSLVRQLVVLVPAAYLLSLSGKVENVWFAWPIAEIASLIMSTIFLYLSFKKLKWNHVGGAPKE